MGLPPGTTTTAAPTPEITVEEAWAGLELLRITRTIWSITGASSEVREAGSSGHIITPTTTSAIVEETGSMSKAESVNEAIYETGSLLGRPVLLKDAPTATST